MRDLQFFIMLANIMEICKATFLNLNFQIIWLNDWFKYQPYIFFLMQINANEHYGCKLYLPQVEATFKRTL